MAPPRAASVSALELEKLAESPVLIGHRYDGLFNRFICFLNVLRLADELDKEPLFLWEVGPQGDNAAHGYDESLTSVIPDERIHDVASDRRQGPPTGVNVRYGNPVALPGESHEEAWERLRVIARRLPLSGGTTIEAALADGGFTAGVHARQGDSRSLTWVMRKYFPAPGWVRVVAQLQDSLGRGRHDIYFATDSDDLRNHVREAFPRHVVTLSDIAEPEWGKLRCDFTEALMLARSQRLVAPPQSAFSTFASLVSGRPIETPESVLRIAPIVREIVNIARDDYCADVAELLAVCDDTGASTPATERIRQKLSDFPARNRGPAPQWRATLGFLPDSHGRRSDQESVGQGDVLALMDLLRPRSTSVTLRRFGRQGDGGYVLPDDLEGLGGVISIGIGDDVSFDEDLARLGLTVLQFDHTVASPPVDHPHFIFAPMEWAPDDGPARRSLATAVTDLDRQSMGDVESTSQDLLLKFDVEGAEWATLPSISPDVLSRFRIITCELHEFGRLGGPEHFYRVRDAIRRLTQHHTCVHLHGNNASRLTWVRGVPLPSAIEVTLLRNDRAVFTDAPVSVPGPLDFPNDPLRDDVVLTLFR